MGHPIRYRWNRMTRLARAAHQRLNERRDLPRLAYIGALGEENLGDEVMLAAARRCFPGFTVLPLNLPHVEESLMRVGLSGAGYFRGVILGGGTLISSYWAPRVKQAGAWELPLWTLGTGAGSSGFDERESMNIGPWSDLLPSFQGLGIRGPRSLRTVRNLGGAHAEIVGDLALKLAVEQPDPPAEQPRFLVNLALPRDEIYDPEANDWQAQIEYTVALFARQGWEPIGVAMHPRDEMPIRAMLERALGRIVPVARPCSAEAFYRLAAPCRFALAVRLHAAVLACCVGVPPLMIGYRDKCLDFMESVDRAEWYLDQKSVAAGEIVASAQNLAACSAGLRAETLDRVHTLKRSLDRYAANQVTTAEKQHAFQR